MLPQIPGIAEEFRGKIVTPVSIKSDLYLSILAYHVGADKTPYRYLGNNGRVA